MARGKKTDGQYKIDDYKLQQVDVRLRLQDGRRITATDLSRNRRMQ